MVQLPKPPNKGNIHDLILIDIRNANSEAELDKINQNFIEHIHNNKRILAAIRKRREQLINNKN